VRWDIPCLSVHTGKSLRGGFQPMKGIHGVAAGKHNGRACRSGPPAKPLAHYSGWSRTASASSAQIRIQRQQQPQCVDRVETLAAAINWVGRMLAVLSGIQSTSFFSTEHKQPCSSEATHAWASVHSTKYSSSPTSSSSLSSRVPLG
jgi:hypothetical protein